MRRAEESPAASAESRNRLIWAIPAMMVLLASIAAAQASYAGLDRLWGNVQGMGSLGLSKAYMMDHDLDGDVDFVAGSLLRVFNDGRGRLSVGPPPGISPRSSDSQCDFGDLNGDGCVDIYGAQTTLFGPLRDMLLIGNGAWQFVDRAATNLPATDYSCRSVALADIDADGDLDVLLGGMYTLGTTPSTQQNVILLNDGAATFTESTRGGSFTAILDATQGLAVIDIDADGDPDVLEMVDGVTGTLPKFHINDGTGQFTLGQSLPATRAQSYEFGDLDGDGDPDMVMFADGRVLLFENDGRGWLVDVTNRLPPHGLVVHGGAVGDVDDDGDLDLIVVSQPVEVAPGRDQVVWQWTNDGAGRFQDATAGRLPTVGRGIYGGWYVTDVWLADFDLDGDLDVMTNDPAPILMPDGNRIFWNMARQVYAPSAARIGQPYDLELHADAGHFVLPAASFTADRVWIDRLGFLGLGAATLVTGAPLPVPASRQVTMTFTVPNDQALIGQHIYWQGVDLDPRAGTARFTNTFEETFAQ